MSGSGTDKTKRWVAMPGPVVILVEPQLGDNIGAVARAMANFGLSQTAAGEAARWLAQSARLRRGIGRRPHPQ